MLFARTRQTQGVTKNTFRIAALLLRVFLSAAHAASLMCFLSACLALSTAWAIHIANAPQHPSAVKKKHKPVKILKHSLRTAHNPKVAKKPAKPFHPFGPPLPPEREAVMHQAKQLVTDWKAGRLVLMNNTRDGDQITTLAAAGVVAWPPPEKKPPAVPLVHDPPPANEDDTDTIPVAGQTNAPSRHKPSTARLQPAATPTPEKVDPNAWTVSPPPAASLMRLLTVLSKHATPRHPLVVLSLLRPPYQTAYWRHAGPHNPHSLGYAADIAEYNGHRVDQEHPEECVQAALAMLRDLPPARYRMGMPKAPEGPVIVGRQPWPAALSQLITALTPPEVRMSLGQPISRTLPSRHRRGRQITETLPTVPKAADIGTVGMGGAALGLACGGVLPGWPFFPAPEPEIKNGVVAPLLLSNGKASVDASGKPLPHLIKFRNENYAAENELADPRIKHALQNARKRGVDVVALFPDAADHIHIDVRPVK